MRHFLSLLILLALFFFSCKSTEKKKDIKTEDKLLLLDKPLVELLDTTLDSLAYIKALSEIAIQKLTLHKNVRYFDTSAIFRGYDGKIKFYQGNLFSNKRQNAIVEVDDNDWHPFLFFSKENDWRLKESLYVIGRVGDSAVQFCDYNFDGFNDIAIIWDYTGGRCTCNYPGCRNLYLYNNSTDSLIEVPQISQYLEFGMSQKEKAIYLGEHCDGFYGKFCWQNGQLKKKEEFLFLEKGSLIDTGPWTMEHNKYRNDKKNYTFRQKNGQMPRSWQDIFNIEGH